MTRTVVGLFRDPDEAQVAVHDLVQAGFANADISIVTRKGEPGEEDPSTANVSAENTSGTMKGAAIGGLAGALLGVAALAIPGIGPVLAAGPIAAALTGAGVGAATGGIFGALSDMGVPEHEAHYLAEGIRRGGTLVVVHATPDNSDRAQSVLDRHGAIGIEAGEVESRARSRTYERMHPGNRR
jgi:uncharacterized membrane protein